MKKTLSEIAIELNRQSGNEHMPSMIFVTDQQAQPYPERIIENLPQNAMVVLRDYDHESRANLAGALAYVCKQKGIKILIAKDLTLALQIGADGLHLPEYMIEQLSHLKREHPSLFISVSCHTSGTVQTAEAAGADAILIAPVFTTASHPQTIGNEDLVLGPVKLKELCGKSKTPIYALGGINAETAPRLIDTGVSGIAAIRGFS